LTLATYAYGPASFLVSSQPSGISCGSSCYYQVAYLAAGTRVTLDAGAKAGTLVRWAGACSGAMSSCTVTMNGPQSVSLFANAWNYAFTTSTTTTANLGGLAGADALCQQAAVRGGLPGNYRAWLSTDNTSAASRFAGARGWVRVDGKPVFDSLPGPIYYPIALDELGHAAGNIFTWTGTADATGARDGCSTCSEWTSDGDGPDGSYVGDDTCPGDPRYTTGGWSDETYPVPCNQSEALFCLGTDLSASLTPTKTSGRIAFVTKSSWDPTTGIAAADSLCGLEAEAGTLTGTFLAFVSTSAVPAAKRFDLTGPNWVRTDGLPIATSPAALATGTVQTTITATSDGAYAAAPNVWTGGSQGGTPNAPSDAGSTCEDWSEAGVVGARGRANATDLWFYNDYVPPACTDQFPIYCFEE
jgi:hypothetical protein